MADPNTPTPPPFRMPPISGRAVLMVEDEPVIRRLAGAALTGAGLMVTEAGTLARAAEVLRTASKPFDLVLLDLTLPDGAGADLIPLIRQHGHETRVLVVSGSSEEDPAAIGADACLPKPFTRVPLLMAVQRLLNPTGQTTPPKPATS